MDRVMLDATGQNARWLAANQPRPDLIAFYETGGPNIAWHPEDLALFPGCVRVSIDQGFTGSPVTTATVRDVEAGAWSANPAEHDKPWTAPRKTIYCARNSIPDVLAGGWNGDVWLAWPGYNSPNPPKVPGCNVVAVQRDFETEYDRSIVYDTTWPFLPAKDDNVIYTSVGKGGRLTIPFPAGSFTQVMFAHDFTNPAVKFNLRVAVRSASKGYSVHVLTDATNGPVPFIFTEHDVDAISVVNTDGPDDVGVTLA